MKLNINDWMDGWFLSLSGNPEKLDEYIKKFEHTRTIGQICLVVVIALLFFILTSGKNINDNSFIFVYVMFVFLLVLTLHADTYTKFLKLHRLQQNRDTSDAKPPSGVAKKSSISVIAWTYGTALGALILGFLTFLYIT